jgi:predicted ester cyclase
MGTDRSGPHPTHRPEAPCLAGDFFRFVSGPHAGRAQTLAAFAEIRTAFPDMSLEILEMIAEGDTVVTHWRPTATHRGPYRGVAPTGQQVTWSGLALHRVGDGRIAEHLAFPDARAPGGPHEIASRKPRSD